MGEWSIQTTVSVMLALMVVTVLNLVYTAHVAVDVHSSSTFGTATLARGIEVHAGGDVLHRPAQQQRKTPSSSKPSPRRANIKSSDDDDDTDSEDGDSTARLRDDNAQLRERVKLLEASQSELEARLADTPTDSAAIAAASSASGTNMEGDAPWFFKGYSWAATPQYEVLPDTPFDSKQCYKPKPPIWEWFMGPPGFILEHHGFCEAHYFSEVDADGMLTMNGCPAHSKPMYGYKRFGITVPFPGKPVLIHPKEFVFTSCTFDVQGYQTNLLFMPERRSLKALVAGDGGRDGRGRRGRGANGDGDGGGNKGREHKQKKHYNVLHFLVDAVSHREFQRMFPYTLNYFNLAKSSVFKNYAKRQLNL
jgi:hypothetical protein